MNILSVILLLLTAYITVDSRLVPSNEVQVQKTPEIISDDFGEEYKLAYNKSALLVREKRSILATVLITFGLPYLCYVLVNVTPIDGSLKRWALKYWGFREGEEGARYRKLAELVMRNVPVDADGNLGEIRDFIDTPPEWQDQIITFRQHAVITITEIMEDEVREEARMNQEIQEARMNQENQEVRMNQENQETRMKRENQKTPERGINAPVLLSKVTNREHLDQITKAMMADNIIYLLISINGTGQTTWKVNPNNQKHRDIYETLLRIKAAIDRKYRDRCPLKKFTAKELPEIKAWYVRLLGGVPEWFSNLFSGVKAAEHKKITLNEENKKEIKDIHAMSEELLEILGKVKENWHKLDAELAGSIKNFIDAVKVLPPKEEPLKRKEGNDRAKIVPAKLKQGAELLRMPPPLSNKTHPVAKSHKRQQDTEPFIYVPMRDLLEHH